MLPYRRLDLNPFPDLGNNVLEALQSCERREPAIQPSAKDPYQFYELSN